MSEGHKPLTALIVEETAQPFTLLYKVDVLDIISVEGGEGSQLFVLDEPLHPHLRPMPVHHVIPVMSSASEQCHKHLAASILEQTFASVHTVDVLDIIGL